MEPTKFIWMNGELVKWQEANVHVLTHALHYGSGAFEGIRVYKTERSPAVFRLKEHMERLHYSAKALKMKLPYTVEDLCNATLMTLRENGLEQGYIRPLVYYSYGVMGLNPRDASVHTAIACWPWGKYLPHEAVDVKISDYIRIHPKSTVGDAKLVGHYINSIMAVQGLSGTQYHEALFLDYRGNIAEGPGENFFIVKAGSLYTPKKGAILAGITRDTIIQLAAKFGIKTEETDLTAADAAAADEAFFTGTAAEVTPIRSLDDKVFGNGSPGAITAQLRDAYQDLVSGRNKDFDHFLAYING